MSITVYSKPACVQCNATYRALDKVGLDYDDRRHQHRPVGPRLRHVARPHAGPRRGRRCRPLVRLPAGPHPLAGRGQRGRCRLTGAASPHDHRVAGGRRHGRAACADELPTTRIRRTPSRTEERREMSSLVYFSSVSENTHRFVEKLGLPAQRIPLTPGEPPLRVIEPYVLVLPTYGGGKEGGAVPRQVVKFLNDEHNRASDPRRHRRGQHQLRRRRTCYAGRHRLRQVRRAVPVPLRTHGHHGGRHPRPREDSEGQMCYQPTLRPVIPGRSRARLPRAQRDAEPVRRGRQDPVRQGP